MDLDPAEKELDSFSLLLPLPFRLGFVVCVGVWLWGMNLQGMGMVKIVRLSHNRPPP